MLQLHFAVTIVVVIVIHSMCVCFISAEAFSFIRCVPLFFKMFFKNKTINRNALLRVIFIIFTYSLLEYFWRAENHPLPHSKNAFMRVERRRKLAGWNSNEQRRKRGRKARHLWSKVMNNVYFKKSTSNF